jgi:CheY-like chemotaxis protein
MEALGRLAGGVAHDFNNLLQAMLGPLQLMVLTGARPDRVAATAEGLQGLVERGAALTRRLLLFSRHEAASPEACDLTEMVRGETGLLRRLLKENVELRFEPGPSPMSVLADRRQLEQVLLNLVVNAADAMPHGGLLVLSTGADEAGVWFEVADSGVGMPPETRQRAFEPFFTTKRASEGTGLGLSIVDGIVRAHGGVVELESEVGKGTTFRVRLPRRVAPATPELDARTAAPSLPLGAGERVLIIEDDTGARESLKELVRLLGYRVSALGSGEEGAALPVHPPFDVLLTDLVLPGMSGLEVTALLRERWPRLRVVLMSGYTEVEALGSHTADSRLRFIAKPIDRVGLAQELRAALDEGNSLVAGT